MIRWTFREHGEVDSTQTAAKALAADGAPEGTVVTARTQSSGSGRTGRPWLSPAGGLYMSFILRPENLVSPELVTLITSVAVADGLGEAAGLSTSIRWPNDVLANGRKIAGIIAEAQASKGLVTQITVGVGVNCNTSESELAALEGEATSVAMELGKQVEVQEVARSILDSFSGLYERWRSGEDLTGAWKGRVATLGKEVLVKLKARERPFTCLAEDIDREGNLVVRSDGESMVIRAVEMDWLREHA